MIKIITLPSIQANCNWCKSYFGSFPVKLYEFRLWRLKIQYWDYSRNNGKLERKSYIHISIVKDGFVKFQREIKLWS